VDLRTSQLQYARDNHPGPLYLQADATVLPFRDGAFDRVHCSWLLEHVPQPARVVAEVRRVLAPGGMAQFAEVDNASFRAEPTTPEVDETLASLDRAQVEAGGDPLVGQKLAALFQNASFSRTEVSPVLLQGDGRDPAFFRGLVEEFAEIFEGLDEALGPEHAARAALAAKQLRRLLELPGASLTYRPVVAQVWR
ncbi:MAG TPA: methyltransferase domain-containing protein, partial [Myxococcaceae bacterium]|nr:methyltransferase domain-containing protein [Myxococcaceae bacterium]